MSISVQDLVQREVHLCLSSMVSTLAKSQGEIAAMPLAELADQALELAAPVLDYEEAARQAGWRPVPVPFKAAAVLRDGAADGSEPRHVRAATWEAACERDNLDAYEWEVYEHWAVSTWLAEKLQAAGERVDTDFAGLNVWARTTTGQAIRADAVIERIHAALVAPETV